MAARNPHITERNRCPENQTYLYHEETATGWTRGCVPESELEAVHSTTSSLIIPVHTKIVRTVMTSWPIHQAFPMLDFLGYMKSQCLKMGQLRILNMPLTWSCHCSPRWGYPLAISTAGCSHGNSRRRNSTSGYICSANDKPINDVSPNSISELPNCTSNLQDAESRNTWVSSTNELVAQYQVPGARHRGRRQAPLTRCSKRATPSQYQHLRVRVQRPDRIGRLRIHTTIYSRQIARKFDTHLSITSDSDSDSATDLD